MKRNRSRYFSSRTLWSAGDVWPQTLSEIGIDVNPWVIDARITPSSLVDRSCAGSFSHNPMHKVQLEPRNQQTHHAGNTRNKIWTFMHALKNLPGFKFNGVGTLQNLVFQRQTRTFVARYFLKRVCDHFISVRIPKKERNDWTKLFFREVVPVARDMGINYGRTVFNSQITITCIP